MIERNSVLEQEAARVVIVAAALDDLDAEGRDEDTAIHAHIASPGAEGIGEIELLDRLPAASAARLGGVDDAGGIAEGERGRHAEREAPARRAGDVDFAEAETRLPVVDVEGAPDVVHADGLAAGRDDGSEGAARSRAGRA